MDAIPLQPPEAVGDDTLGGPPTRFHYQVAPYDHAQMDTSESPTILMSVGSAASGDAGQTPMTVVETRQITRHISYGPMTGGTMPEQDLLMTEVETMRNRMQQLEQNAETVMQQLRLEIRAEARESLQAQREYFSEQAQRAIRTSYEEGTEIGASASANLTEHYLENAELHYQNATAHRRMMICSKLGRFEDAKGSWKAKIRMVNRSMNQILRGLTRGIQQIGRCLSK